MIGFLAVLAACVLVGRAVGPRPPADASLGFALAGWTLAGVAALHLWLGSLSLAGLRWSAASVGFPVAVAALAGAARLLAARPPLRPLRPGWGDVLALTALAGFAWLALDLRVVSSDFFHHWGAKGQRFFLAQGIDYDYLAAPWNDQVVGWYPTGLPELYAAAGLAQGEFSVRPAMAWSVVWALVTFAAAREAFLRGGLAPLARQAFTAAVAALVAGAGIALRLAGGADLMVAAGLTLAAVALLAPPASSNAAPVAIAAAFLASSKVEGVALAAILLAVDQLRRLAGRRFSWRVAGAQALPALLVALLWLGHLARLGAGGPPSLGGIEPGRLLEVARAMGAELLRQPLLGFPWLLFTIPLALAMKASRWVGLAALAALLFFVAAYAASPAGPHEYVRSTFHRLLAQVIPALLTATAIAAAGRRRQGQEGAG